MDKYGYIGRKLKQPKLAETPAIIIVNFGTTSRSEAVLELFTNELAERYAQYRIFHAFTSAVIRCHTGNPSLHEALARAEAENFRRVVVLPLQIFPGTEYQQIRETCQFFPGLRVFLGETLMHRWNFVDEVIEVISEDFLGPDEGVNLLALHGTPLVADPANIAYLGLADLLYNRFGNVFLAALDGIPDFDGICRRLLHHREAGKPVKVRLIPLLYFAGVHAEEDMLGEEKESWRNRLLAGGCHEVECPTVTLKGGEYLKGLGCSARLRQFFFARLDRALKLAQYY